MATPQPSTDSLFQDQLAPAREICAIGGGKGGTGKTFLAAGLGISLAKMGKRVILVDADLGCANLHTALGLPYPEETLSDFMKEKVKRLSDVIVESGVENLRLISGAQDFLEIANPRYKEKMRLIRQVQNLDVDFIILDLGAGTSFTILDFFLSAANGLLAVVPEPGSIENVYRFIKSVYFRKFKKVARDPDMRALITQAMDHKNTLGLKTPHDLVLHIQTINPELGARLMASLASIRPKLVVNQVRTRDDIALGFSMRSSCSKYFGIDVEYLGYIEYDDTVRLAARHKRPLMQEYPYCSAARCIERVAQNLVKKEQLNVEFILRP
ncbi:MAG: AAA family ATPase [Nitrospirota bacterium]